MTRAAAGVTAREERGLRTRQRLRLIEACISALHLHGPSRTTVDKVVSIADMSPGIVNFYFESKAALLVATLEHLSVEFEERVLAPVAALQAAPARALALLIALYLDPEIASPRKISVWYSFWGEASSRGEYKEICGKRDDAFFDLVAALIRRLVEERGDAHLDSDAIALGLIGVLEMTWQDFAFHEESEIDRTRAKGRCEAYLRSVFPDAEHVAGRAAVPQEAEILAVAAALAAGGAQVTRMACGWPGYQLLVFPPGGAELRVRVCSVESVRYRASEVFDVLAVAEREAREIYAVPRKDADALLAFESGWHGCAPAQVARRLKDFRRGGFSTSPIAPGSVSGERRGSKAKQRPAPVS